MLAISAVKTDRVTAPKAQRVCTSVYEQARQPGAPPSARCFCAAKVGRTGHTNTGTALISN